MAIGVQGIAAKYKDPFVDLSWGIRLEDAKWNISRCHFVPGDVVFNSHGIDFRLKLEVFAIHPFYQVFDVYSPDFTLNC